MSSSLRCPSRQLGEERRAPGRQRRRETRSDSKTPLGGNGQQPALSPGPLPLLCAGSFPHLCALTLLAGARERPVLKGRGSLQILVVL